MRQGSSSAKLRLNLEKLRVKNLPEMGCNTMDRTEKAVHDLLQALDARSYDVGIANERGLLPSHNDLPASAVLKRIPFLKYQNARGSHIYVRPSGEHRYTLLDDLSVPSLEQLTSEGYGPAAVIETSPGNYQARLKHATALPAALSTLAAQRLARQFNADPGAADWRHFGRMPGFTNCKLKHRLADGRFPYALLRSASGREFPAAETFYRELAGNCARLEVRREAQVNKRLGTLSPPEGERYSHLSLTRFRLLAKYRGRPAQADMAFCIAACSTGMPDGEIAAALKTDYLSQDKSSVRRQAYIHRTMQTAQSWAMNPAGRTRNDERGSL